MTDVRTFRAPNMQAALNLVRDEMGRDAVILHTRQVPLRRLLPWGKAKEEVEITAGLGVAIRSQADSASDSAMKTGTKSASALQKKSSTTLELPPPSPAFKRRQEQGTGSSTAPLSLPTGKNSSQSSSNVQSQQASPASSFFSGGTNRQSPQSTQSRAPAPPVPQRSTPPRGVQQRESTNAHDPNILFAQKIDTLQKMIEDLARSTQKKSNVEIPAELFQLYTQLIDADVEDELARELIFRIPQRDRKLIGKEMDAAKAQLTAMVASEIHCGSIIAPDRTRRKVVALVGPTGVGKTTTIAKLAANFRLRENVRMGLVTVDTYRIAAVEQLRTYAEIIDLPMKVVTSPSEMKRALDELSGMELVLIDTGGRSPRDEMKIQELKSMLAEAQADEVHLVLGLNASLKSLESSIELFRPVNVSSLLFSKLDEAPSLGTILSLTRKFPWPISYITTGQDVPDDIEPAHADRLARLILGQDRLAP